jgi:hypothetical protein
MDAGKPQRDGSPNAVLDELPPKGADDQFRKYIQESFVTSSFCEAIWEERPDGGRDRDVCHERFRDRSQRRIELLVDHKTSKALPGCIQVNTRARVDP